MSLPEILSLKPRHMLDPFLETAAKAGVSDPERVRSIAVARIAALRGKELTADQADLLDPLDNHWDESVRAGAPDFGIYLGDDYLGELWACWAIYSRLYLRSIAKAGSLQKDGRSVVEELEDDGALRIADLGCGFGYTTLALLGLFPSADVVGTNVAGSAQYRMADALGQLHGFSVFPELTEPADLVFASEYFEHFQEPLTHLDMILDVAAPSSLLVANAFAPASIGHFDWYEQDGKRVSPPAMSRAFQTRLRKRGYEKTTTQLWNQRPALWTLIG